MTSPRRGITAALLTATLMAASGLLTASSAGSTAAEAAEAADPNLEVTEAVRTYFVTKDQHWLSAAAPSMTLSSTAQAAVDEVGRLRREIAADGLQASKVDTQVGITSTDVTGETAEVTAMVSTALRWVGGPSEPSVLTDEHILSLHRRGSAWVPVDDQVVAPQNNSAEDEADSAEANSAPGGPPSSVDRAAALKEPESAPESDFSAGYSRSSMASYARYWSGCDRRPYNGACIPRFNRNPYGAPLDNDCTNFVSQALRAGGWQTLGTTNNTDLRKWTYDVFGPRRFSWTWSKAWALERFSTSSGRTTRLGNVYNARPGDLLFTDWDDDPAFDHVMMVTDRVNREPYISQHSPHRHNIPLSLSRSYADPNTRWYGRDV